MGEVLCSPVYLEHAAYGAVEAARRGGGGVLRRGCRGGRAVRGGLALDGRGLRGASGGVSVLRGYGVRLEMVFLGGVFSDVGKI